MFRKGALWVSLSAALVSTLCKYFSCLQKLASVLQFSYATANNFSSSLFDLACQLFILSAFAFHVCRNRLGPSLKVLVTATCLC
ncbi:hypothetical protein ZEAMMB73_Zm00001d009482 [Zea mays]|jgi:hypothetical protein|uniref:Uncharacterized protein n=1 Tax=Zea mays TaxID=4577 RepID=A0A1D6FJP1_MAIZE|nr:hypothetical protein ZEAMMB73_Zm00001d009482 [Zea mays]